MLESAYEECLYWELGQAALAVRRQVPLPVLYKEVKLDAGYRLDLVVEGQLIVELKTVDKASTDSRSPTTDLSEAQRDERTGLLLNFNSTVLKGGIKRIVR